MLKLPNVFLLFLKIIANFAFENIIPDYSREIMKLYSDAELAEILDNDIFHLIGDAADHLGLECYVVGGYVRDIFLERPSNDIDVVVVGSGIALAKEVKKRFGRKAHLSVFKNFGTAQVRWAKI